MSTLRYKAGDRVKINPKAIAVIEQRAGILDARESIQAHVADFGTLRERVVGAAITVDQKAAYTLEYFFVYDHEVR